MKSLSIKVRAITTIECTNKKCYMIVEPSKCNNFRQFSLIYIGIKLLSNVGHSKLTNAINNTRNLRVSLHLLDRLFNKD